MLHGPLAATVGDSELVLCRASSAVALNEVRTCTRTTHEQARTCEYLSVEVPGALMWLRARVLIGALTHRRTPQARMHAHSLGIDRHASARRRGPSRHGDARALYKQRSAVPGDSSRSCRRTHRAGAHGLAQRGRAATRAHRRRTSASGPARAPQVSTQSSQWSFSTGKALRAYSRVPSPFSTGAFTAGRLLHKGQIAYPEYCMAPSRVLTVPISPDVPASTSL